MHSVLILGSGGLRVGQAGEFDYSGSQAVKAFKEDGVRTVLINPNIATVQTDPSMADEIYFLPLNCESVVSVLKKEKINYIALGFGGQTALNLGIELYEQGILDEYNVAVLGSKIDNIKKAEDRGLFRDILSENNIKTPNSKVVFQLSDVIEYAKHTNYPIMIRSGFTLGGLGSNIVHKEEELLEKVRLALISSPHILLEEYLTGWKEFEYEVIRDSYDNCLTICSMENMDPMGIHTGESIVVAPIQTLDNSIQQKMRDLAIKCARIFDIIGECNVQFAINPANCDYRVIEMNPRLSRSSALASKATGYPLAYIAAKITLKYPLYELKNPINDVTSAFFEPALDYIVVKIPKWDMHKIDFTKRVINTEMKSIGEVMGIGRTFMEAIQKAVQMLNLDVLDLTDKCNLNYSYSDLQNSLKEATDRRVFALFRWFFYDYSLDEAYTLTLIDKWFLEQIRQIAVFYKEFFSSKLTVNTVLCAKQLGFSDYAISNAVGCDLQQIMNFRKENNILPIVKKIDSSAAEFEASSNYLYVSYNATESDVQPIEDAICIIGSGPYSIGSSVEFDWCTVNLARQFRSRKYKVIIINCNPETVSTDYDESDRLYFDLLTFERITDILYFEQITKICVSVGGQIANNLALDLHNAGYEVLGTNPNNIDMAENRTLFSQLLTNNNINQPLWTVASSNESIKQFIDKVGWPVIIRPSYVLSGSAMRVIYSQNALDMYSQQTGSISSKYPVVISEFIDNAKELEIDGIATNGRIVIYAISEHVENAGVHSGDATIIFPPEKLYLKTAVKAKDIADKIIHNLNIHGPFNIQLLAKNNELKVIECNVRASRSFPFISKVSGHNFIKIMVDVWLNKPVFIGDINLTSNRIGVKCPIFSYNRFKGSDPVAHVEMAATGEVACIGNNLLSTFYLSWLATGVKLVGKSILISIDDKYKLALLPQVRLLSQQRWNIYATEKTHDYFVKNGIHCSCVFKISTQLSPNVKDLISMQKINLIINLSGDIRSKPRTDGYFLRRMAIDFHVPLITNFNLATLILDSIINFYDKKIPIFSYRELLQGEYTND